MIVPAHQAADLLTDTLAALRRSDPPGVVWELVVVDDGSSDRTAEVAALWADQVIHLEAPAAGPAHARNAGAQVAKGEWLLFVDADVRVGPDTLRNFWQSAQAHPGAGAIFGAYDDRPESPGLISRYRNLLHRYVHLRGAGPAETFWAGLGGVRADRFRQVGGFDGSRYPRPQIEDIEFGYRLRDAGVAIVLDPTIEGTHLKRWTFGRMAPTDFRDRALPWARLLLERWGKRTPTLNTAPQEQVRVAVAGAALATAAAGVLWLDARLAWASLGLLVLLAALGFPVLRWFAGQRGVGFAMAAVPLLWWYYLANAAATSVAVLAHCSRIEPPAAIGWRPRHWAVVMGLLVAATAVGWKTRAPDVGVGGDEATYIALSHSLDQGRYRDEFIAGSPLHAKYPPGNPLWIGAIRRLAGPSLEWLRGANLGLLILVALLVGDAVRRLAGPWPGVLSVGLVSLCPSLLDVSGTGLSEAPFVIVTVAALWVAFRGDGRSDRDPWIVSALAFASFLIRTAGVALVVAIGIEALRRRRFRFALIYGVLSIVIVGGWFAYGVQVAGTTGGSTYSADLRHIGRPGLEAPHGRALGFLVQTLGNITGYLHAMPWALGIPGLHRIGADLPFIVLLIVVATIGFFVLARRWPLAAIHALVYGVVLVVWPWMDERLMFPVIPVVSAALVLGGLGVANALPKRMAAGVYGLLILAPLVVGASSLVRNRSMLNCDRTNPYDDPDCFGPDARGLVAAARLIGANAADSTVVATAKPATVFYFSGHRTVPLKRLTATEPSSGTKGGWFGGVDLILLSRVDRGVGDPGSVAMLQRHCSDLEVSVPLSLGALILAPRSPHATGANACAALAAHAR